MIESNMGFITGAEVKEDNVWRLCCSVSSFIRTFILLGTNLTKKFGD